MLNEKEYALNSAEKSLADMRELNSKHYDEKLRIGKVDLYKI